MSRNNFTNIKKGALIAAIGFAIAFFQGIAGHAQIINTIAGNGTNGYSGDNGPATDAQVSEPNNIAFDTLGNLYVADPGNNAIRKITPAGIISTVAGGNGAGYSGDNGLAINAQLNRPAGVAIDAVGNIYIADQSNRIRKISTAGIITTVVGTGLAGYSGDGSLAISAQINNAKNIAFDAAGNMYIADAGNNIIRKVNASGIISTVAGSGAPGYSGDNYQATTAQLNFPEDVAIDAAGNMYIADAGNNVVRKVNTAGIITTVTTGLLGSPDAVTFDASGNMYVSDFSTVQEVNTSGVASVVAGAIGYAAYLGDGGPATGSRLSGPAGIAFDKSGNLYIADGGNQRIRRILSGCNNVTAGTIISAAGNVFCGSANTLLSLNGETVDSGISYQWQSSADGISWTNTGTDSFIYSTGNITASTYYRGIVTCASSAHADTTAVDELSFTANVTPAVSIIASYPNDTVCAGSVVTFIATPVNGGNNPTYQWLKNGVAVGTTSATYADTALAGNDSIVCIMTSSVSCASPAIATSNSINIAINPINIPTVSISSNMSDTVLVGTMIMFTATVTNGGTNPIYQWTITGINGTNNVATAGNTLAINTLNNGDVITCSVIANAGVTCASPIPVVSNGITITLIYPPNCIPNSLYGCQQGDFFASFTTTGGLINIDDETGCQSTSNGQAYFYDSTDTVKAIVGSTINLSVQNNPAGYGEQYEIWIDWNHDGFFELNENVYNNELNQGDIATIPVTVPASAVGGATRIRVACGENDGGTAVDFSDDPCGELGYGTSKDYVFVVVPVCSGTPVAGNIINSGGNTLCGPGTDTLTLNGNTVAQGITYQWQTSTDAINWVNTGTDTTIYSTPTLSATTYYRNVVTCTTSNMQDTTQTDTIAIASIVNASVTIAATPGTNIAVGQSDTMTAVVVNGGSTPAYQWQRNGINIPGATSGKYISNAFSNGDTITCIVTSSAPCAAPATSNKLIMHVTQLGIASVQAGDNSIQLHPNPNNGTFSITGTINDHDAQVEVLNVIGQVIYSTKMTAQNGRINGQIVLPVENANGIYLVRVQAGNSRQMIRFILER